MQLRLGTRRIQMAAWSIGMAQRALDMICEYAPQRVTFGVPLSERQAIQWWVADAATRIHAARLMTYDCAWKLDQGRDVRLEISMIKAFATEMAWEVVDHAMQTFGAMGMTKEMPLQLMAPSCAPCASMTAPPKCTNGWWRATFWEAVRLCSP
jgi:acyl-CoA dehydrogenase